MIQGNVKDLSLKNDFFNHRCNLKIGNNELSNIRFHTGIFFLPIRKLLGNVVEVKDNTTQQIYWVNKNSLCKHYRTQKENPGLSDSQIIGALSNVVKRNSQVDKMTNKPKFSQDEAPIGRELENIGPTITKKFNDFQVDMPSMGEELDGIGPKIMKMVNENRLVGKPFSLILVVNTENGGKKSMIDMKIEQEGTANVDEKLLRNSLNEIFKKLDTKKQQNIHVVALMNNSGKDVNVSAFDFKIAPQSEFEISNSHYSHDVVISKENLPNIFDVLFDDSNAITEDKRKEYISFLKKTYE